MTLARGWKRRQLDAQENYADAEKARIREERARYYEEMELQAQAQRHEAEARRQRTFIACPCCSGQGRVTVDQAELTYRAFERLPAASSPDPDVLDILNAVARGEPVHSRFTVPVKNGLAAPRAVDGGLAPQPADITPRPEPVTPKRPAKVVKVDPPWLDPDALLESDD